MRRRTFLLSIAALLPAASAQAAGKTAAGATQLYKRFPAISVSVTLPGGRRGVMTVEAGVEAVDEALAERVLLAKPRLRDAWFAALQRIGAGARPGRPPDADAIARELQLATDRVMGRKGATFLLGSILVH